MITIPSNKINQAPVARAAAVTARRIGDVTVPVYLHTRLSTGFGWLNEIYGGCSLSSSGPPSADNGGGITPSSSIIFTGDPGAGKSTLLCEQLARMTQGTLSVLAPLAYEDTSHWSKSRISDAVAELSADTGHNQSIVVLNSVEESAENVKRRALRSSTDASLYDELLYEEHQDIEDIILHQSALISAERANGWTGAYILAIDSLQELYFQDRGTIQAQAAGLRELTNFVKRQNGVLICINQVTTTGRAAGSKKNEHGVEVSLHLESPSPKYIEQNDLQGYEQPRILKIRKNRFGTTGVNYVLSLGSNGFTPVARDVIGG